MRFLLAIVVCVAAVSAAGARYPAPREAASQQFSAWAQTNIHPAVARIVAPGQGSISYGSGTLVYADDRYGLVVTNWHVINEATGPISVHFPDGFYSLGSVETVDRDWDLALIAIRKPTASPVALADKAPQPGEILTIAGYGLGDYRAASGVCTQYVAPGLEFPYEMVEVAVSARQGDSGGPIFNSRGELAGVLFGQGEGRTSGSYCGRVRWFLSSIVPNLDRAALVAATPLKTVPARPAGIEPWPQPPRSQWQSVEPPVEDRPAVVASTRSSEQPAPEMRQIGWTDVAGETLGEQMKTVLAGIGLLAIVLTVLRVLSREGVAAGQ